MASSKNQQTPQWTTASQLAEMGYCERKVLLKHIHGPRVAGLRTLRQIRGITEHERFFMEAREQASQLISDRQAPSELDSVASRGVLQRMLFQFTALLRRLTRWVE